ncbi:DNA polymerase I [Candidatus Kinetoplastibacterium desouzaii TCC079E]|uniref:DNA polymerase I n=2 Tax=Candidatus Kinetoplastidibacterium desouzai TaxID=994692 RepID=M1L2I2_9PROT|nr:DNA polymerase I [Candidatus Kinetoplastibacterium desouzaii TCC079E]
MMDESLLLVDGSSYLYRAFYALPDLRNSKGEPTGAIYGVISMLRKLIMEYDPKYFVCVFDAPGKTFRNDISSDYKSNRPSMPEELVFQIDKIHQIINALGLFVLSVNGVEADDVIGTIAKTASKLDNLQVIISTGDKDLAQLVNSKIRIINTMNGEILDNAGVLKKFGVNPALIVDYLMLVGDSVDNIPGVPKIGPKTAIKLLNEFGNIDNIILSADKIKGIVGANLIKFIPNFTITKELLTIKCDCILSSYFEKIEDFSRKPLNINLLKDLYLNLGFSSWLNDLNKIDIKPQTKMVDKELNLCLNFCLVNNANSFKDFFMKLEKSELTIIDTYIIKSIFLSSIRLMALSFLIDDITYYIPFYNLELNSITRVEILSILKPWLENNNKFKILYDAKTSLHVFSILNIDLNGIKDDVMLEAYVLDSHNNLDLYKLVDKFLCCDYLSHDDVFGRGQKTKNIESISNEIISKYFSQRINFIKKLHFLLRPLLAKEINLEYIYDLEKVISRNLKLIEANGVKIDKSDLENQSSFLEGKILELEREIYILAETEFNINSPKQLGDVLFKLMNLPIIRKTSSGLPSTDESVLSKLSQKYKLPKLVLDYRALSKLKSTYTDKLPRMVDPKTNRVHTTYSQVGVITGRLSSFDPNLQNIPVRTEIGRLIRKAFIPERDCLFVSADYSQIELRIMAHFSQDDNLQTSFKNGIDVHLSTASEIFGLPIDIISDDQRRTAKMINFGLIYGMGVFGLASNLNIDNLSAQNYINKYFARYPGVLNYINSVKSNVRELGYVETIFGRRLYLPTASKKSFNKQAIDRLAINAPIQGTAADLIKKAMVSVQEWLNFKNLKSKIVMQVHDELILEVPQVELTIIIDNISNLMCNVIDLNIPLVVDIGVGNNWSEAH